MVAVGSLERAGAEVVECACVIELPELKVWIRTCSEMSVYCLELLKLMSYLLLQGRERLNGKPLYILVESR